MGVGGLLAYPADQLGPEEGRLARASHGRGSSAPTPWAGLAQGPGRRTPPPTTQAPRPQLGARPLCPHRGGLSLPLPCPLCTGLCDLGS